MTIHLYIHPADLKLKICLPYQKKLIHTECEQIRIFDKSAWLQKRNIIEMASTGIHIHLSSCVFL